MFLEKLEYLMNRKGINTLKELSKACDIPYTTLRGFYDKGTDGIRSTTLKKLSSFFGCTIDYLVRDDISKTHILHLAGINEKDYERLRNEIVHGIDNDDIIDISTLSDEEKANIIHIVELMKKNK